jgi:hypothetical protein
MAGAGRQIVERPAEQGGWRDALGRCREGRGGFVLIAAGAGTGKTALLEEALDSARRRRFRVLSTRAPRSAAGAGRASKPSNYPSPDRC